MGLATDTATDEMTEDMGMYGLMKGTDTDEFMHGMDMHEMTKDMGMDDGLMKEIDVDENGLVSFEEMVDWTVSDFSDPGVKETLKETFKESFDKADKDSSGGLNASEMKMFWKELSGTSVAEL